MKTPRFTLRPETFVTNVKFALFMTLLLIFLTDNYRMVDVDPERERVWRIILSLSSFLVVALGVYIANLRFEGKMKRKYMIAIMAGLLGYIFSVSMIYIGYEGLLMALHFVARSLLIGYLFALCLDWHRKSIREKELERQNVQSELTLLKNQINPHFLFNTLNNIDSLIKSNPSKASESLIEMSDMMRYMIYETNVNTVPLKQELNYIENFLKLQSLQYANENLVEYKVKGNPDDIRIAPMLFIPFIENAFKHSTNKEKEYVIKIIFDINDQLLTFTSVNEADKEQIISKDKSSGVGLDIVKRRLELLYPDKYKLEIKEENNLFNVLLTIELR